MAPEIARQPLSEQPWFSEFLSTRGFQKTAPATFSNGRATVRIEGQVLHAIPGDGGRAWRSEIRDSPPGAIRALLAVVLDAPGFLSQVETDRRSARRASAEQALQLISDTIRESPETHSGRHLRQFVWSLFNFHHVTNLWRLKDVLDSRHNDAVTAVFTGWMQGAVSDDALRRTLKDSGEMDRWDTASFYGPERQHLVAAMDTVSQVLTSSPPGESASHLTQVVASLGQALECFPQIHFRFEIATIDTSDHSGGGGASNGKSKYSNTALVRS